MCVIETEEEAKSLASHFSRYPEVQPNTCLHLLNAWCENAFITVNSIVPQIPQVHSVPHILPKVSNHSLPVWTPFSTMTCYNGAVRGRLASSARTNDKDIKKKRSDRQIPPPDAPGFRWPSEELLVVMEALSAEPFKPNPPQAVVHEESAALLASTSAKRLSDLCAVLVHHPNCMLRGDHSSAAMRRTPKVFGALQGSSAGSLGRVFILLLTGKKHMQQFRVF